MRWEAEAVWAVSEALLLSANAARWAPLHCAVPGCELHTTVHAFPALHESDALAIAGTTVAQAAVRVRCRLSTFSAFAAAPQNAEYCEEAVVSCAVLENGDGGTALVRTVYTDGASTTLQVARTLHMAAERRAGNTPLMEFARAHPECAAADSIFVSAARTMEPWQQQMQKQKQRAVHLSAYIAYETGGDALRLIVLEAPADPPGRCAARAGRVRSLCEMLERVLCRGALPLPSASPPQLQGHSFTTAHTRGSPTNATRLTRLSTRADSPALLRPESLSRLSSQSQSNPPLQSNVFLNSVSQAGARTPNGPRPGLPRALPVALHPLLSLYVQTAWRRVSRCEGCDVKVLDTSPPVYCTTTRITCALNTLRRAVERIAPGASAVFGPSEARAARLLSPADGHCTVFAHCASGPMLLGFIVVVAQHALRVHHIARAVCDRSGTAQMREHCARLVALRRTCEEAEANMVPREEIDVDHDEGDVEQCFDEAGTGFMEAATLEDEQHALPPRRGPPRPLTTLRESIEPESYKADTLSVYTHREGSRPGCARRLLPPDESEWDEETGETDPAPPQGLPTGGPAGNGPQRGDEGPGAAQCCTLRVHVRSCRDLAGEFAAQDQRRSRSSSLFVIARSGDAAARTPAVPLTDSTCFGGPPISFHVACAGKSGARNEELRLTAVARTPRGRLHHVGAASMPLCALLGKRWTRWVTLLNRGSRPCGELRLTVDGRRQSSNEMCSSEGDMHTRVWRRSKSRGHSKSNRRQGECRSASNATSGSVHFSNDKVMSQHMEEIERSEVPRKSGTIDARDHRGYGRTVTITASESPDQKKSHTAKENDSYAEIEKSSCAVVEVDPYAGSHLVSEKSPTPLTGRSVVLRIVDVYGLSDEDGLPLCAAVCRISVKSPNGPLMTRDVSLSTLAAFDETFNVADGAPVRISVIAGDMVVGLAEVSAAASPGNRHRTVVLVRDAGTNNAAPGGFATITIGTALLDTPRNTDVHTDVHTDESRERLLLHMWSRDRRALHSHDLLAARQPRSPRAVSPPPLCTLHILLRQLSLPGLRMCEPNSEPHAVSVRVGPHFAFIGTATLRGVLHDRDEMFVVVSGVGVAVLPLAALPVGVAITTTLPIIAAAGTRDAREVGGVTLDLTVGPPAAADAQPLALPEMAGLARVRELLHRYDPRALHRAACLLIGHSGREEAFIEALAARLGVSSNIAKGPTVGQMTLRLLGTRGRAMADMTCYVKAYLNGRAVLRTPDRLGGGVGSVSVALQDPQRARLRFKVARHRYLLWSAIAFAEMRLCCLRGGGGGGGAEHIQWLPLFDADGGRLGELGVALRSNLFPARSGSGSGSSSGQRNGSAFGSDCDSVRGGRAKRERVEDDVASLLRRYDPAALERVQPLVATARSAARAHSDLRRRLIPRVVDTTVFVQVESLRLRDARHAALEGSDLAVTVSCGEDTAGAAWPLAHALRLDICARSAVHGLVVAVREPRGAGPSRAHSGRRSGTPRAPSSARGAHASGSAAGLLDALPAVETGRAVLSLRALLTPELYDREEAVTVPLVAFTQSPRAWLTLQQREAGAGAGNGRGSDVVGNITLRVRTAAFETPQRRLRLNPTALSRHGPVDRMHIRRYEQRIAEMLAEHSPHRLVDLHHVLYERRVGSWKWHSSLREWKNVLERRLGITPSVSEQSE